MSESEDELCVEKSFELVVNFAADCKELAHSCSAIERRFVFFGFGESRRPIYGNGVW